MLMVSEKFKTKFYWWLFKNNYKVALNFLSSKVNEDVKFNSRFVVGSTNTKTLSDAGFAI